jgi:hypothetical protein
MSGIYLLVLLGGWIGLTWLLVASWRRARHMAKDQRKLVDGICVVLVAVWLGGSFWYGGGRKFYYDIQVDRMCRADGGIKVYETARLSAGEYDQYAKGNWLIPDKSEAKPADKYYSETVRHYFREGDPEVSRRQYRIIRVSDGRVLGEQTFYGRGGGDFPGPWHGSSYTCPDRATISGLESAIFVKMCAQ